MPGTSMTQYPANRVDGTQVSSTYEGRHLTFAESEITAPAGLTQKGDPVLVGEDIVGVAFNTAVLGTDLIAVDTEGIWNLEVVGENDEGNIAVAPGDELYINKTTGALSKITNKVTHQRFGYALGTIGAGGVTAVIAVKVHWNPDDELEHVGEAGARSILAIVSPRFREYYYEAQGGGYPKGDHLELTISTLRCTSAQALRRVLQWVNDDTVGGLIGGYAAVGEFDLSVTVGAGGAGSMNTTCVIFLTSHMELTGTHTNNFEASWLRLQEYAQLPADQINNLIALNDADAGDYPYVAATDKLFITLAGDIGATHAFRVVVNNVHYWMLCRNAIV